MLQSEPARLAVQIASAAVTCLVYLTVVFRLQQGMWRLLLGCEYVGQWRDILHTCVQCKFICLGLL
jgi:hypothetical protein